MRRYQLRQRIFSIRDTFNIKNEDGHTVYVVRGRLISLRDRLSFRDLEGNQLLQIRQRLLSLRKTYVILREGRRYAAVTKRWLSFLGSRFKISVVGEPDLRARGNFLDYEYRFSRRGDEVAHVSKRWFALSDSYGVQVSDAVDPLLILACAVIIDRINHTPEDSD